MKLKKTAIFSFLSCFLIAIGIFSFKTFQKLSPTETKLIIKNNQMNINPTQSFGDGVIKNLEKDELKQLTETSASKNFINDSISQNGVYHYQNLRGPKHQKELNTFLGSTSEFIKVNRDEGFTDYKEVELLLKILHIDKNNIEKEISSNSIHIKLTEGNTEENIFIETDKKINMEDDYKISFSLLTPHSTNFIRNGKTQIFQGKGSEIFLQYKFVDENPNPNNKLIERRTFNIKGLKFKFKFKIENKKEKKQRYNISNKVLETYLSHQTHIKCVPVNPLISMVVDPWEVDSYLGIFDETINKVLPNLFTVLRTSTQRNDLKNNEHSSWIDSSNPPELRIGLNNDIFLAYEAFKWKENRKNDEDKMKKFGNRVNAKNKMIELLDNYLVTSSNFSLVQNKLIDDQDISGYLKKPVWEWWTTDEAPKVQGLNIIEWLWESNQHPYYKGDNSSEYPIENYTRTNYQLLSQWLQNQERITFEYKLINSKEPNKVLSKKLTKKDLIDFAIPLVNTSPHDSSAQIQLEGFTFIWKDNYEQSAGTGDQSYTPLKTISSQDLKTNLDFLNDLNNENIEYKIISSTSTNYNNQIVHSINEDALLLLNNEELNIENNNFSVQKSIKGHKIKSDIKPIILENYGHYWIDYNPNSSIYTSYYQPNPLDISEGIKFIPDLASGNNKTTYDKDLNDYEGEVKTNKKAYKSFFYDVIIDGKIIRIPFYQPDLVSYSPDGKLNTQKFKDFFKDINNKDYEYIFKDQRSAFNNKKIIAYNENNLTFGGNKNSENFSNVNFSKESGTYIEKSFIGITPDKEWHESFTTTYPPTGMTSNETLKEWLEKKNKSYNKNNITFVINHNMDLVINPYKKDSEEKLNGTKYFKTKTFELVKVEDKGAGIRDTVLYKKDSDIMSHIVNNSFGIDVMNMRTNEGQLAMGFHDIVVQTKNRPEYNVSVKTYIDTRAPVFSLNGSDGSSSGKRFIKIQDKFYDLYTYNTAVKLLIKDYGLKYAKLSWVDSEGQWTTKNIKIKTSKILGEDWQTAFQNINLQGLFKVEFSDIADNESVFFIWIQKRDSEGNSTLISQATTDNAKGQFNINHHQYFWVDSEQAEFKIINCLSQDLVVDKQDADGNWVKAKNQSDVSDDESHNDGNEGADQDFSGVNDLSMFASRKAGNKLNQADYELETVPNKIDSVGTPLSGVDESNSLMGDEVAKIKNEAHYSDTQPGQKFYGYKLTIKTKGRFKVSFATNIYTKNSDRPEKTPLSQSIYIYNEPNYSINVSGSKRKVTEYAKHQSNKEIEFDENGLVKNYDPHNDIEFDQINKGETLELFSDFIDLTSLKIMRRNFGTNQWFNETSSLYDNYFIFFKKEGFYRIEYKDKNQNQRLNLFLVFDWPNRNLKKAITEKTVEIESKPQKVRLEEYLNPGISRKMEKQQYKVSGYYYPEKYQNKEGASQSDNKHTYIGSEFINISGYVWAQDISTVNIPSWVEVEETGETRQEEVKLKNKSGTLTESAKNLIKSGLTMIGITNPEFVQLKKYRVSGSGQGNYKVLNKIIEEFKFDAIKNKFKFYDEFWDSELQNLNDFNLNADFTNHKYSNILKIHPTLKLEVIPGTLQIMSATELDKTSFFSGKYIDLYRFKNKSSFLVDHDDDSSTRKIHLLKDYDLFIQELKEWVFKEYNGDDTKNQNIKDAFSMLFNSSGNINEGIFKIIQDEAFDDFWRTQRPKDYHQSEQDNYEKKRLAYLLANPEYAQEQGYDFDKKTGSIIIQSESPVQAKKSMQEATQEPETKTPKKDESKPEPMSDGAYVGIAIGTLLAVLGISFLTAFIIRKRRGLRHK